MLFELIQGSLHSLVGRAPDTEAQIYEVEADVMRRFSRWVDATRGALDRADDITQQDKDNLLLICIHALVISAVCGRYIPGNPLMRERPMA